MGKEHRNICTFKKVCNSCTKADLADRPSMCILIKCPYYKLCSLCGNNRKLNDRGLCIDCSGESKVGQNAIPSQARKAAAKAVSTGETNITREENGVLVAHSVSITEPGVPPPELQGREVTYYQKRWSEYKGYYRNPAAYFICHMMILEEINLAFMNSRMLETRGELQQQYASERQRSITVLKLLKEQLPEREMEEVMDDEKAIASIYETYLQEKQIRYMGGVARLLSPGAIALAPSLTFPLDPRELLTRCGFDIVDIEQALEKIDYQPIAKERTPEEVLEFLGFFLKEEYAMPYVVPDTTELFNPHDQSEQHE
jgi:hypothetical protein